MRGGRQAFAIAFAFAVAGFGCEVEPHERSLPEHVLGVGTNEPAVASCLDCHIEIAGDWANLSSHNLVLGCTVCHESVADPPARAHATTPACDRCHSEASHPSGARCVHCHDPHGSTNAFLIHEQIDPPSAPRVQIRFTRPEGMSASGLVRPGAQAGTGLCEVCHQRQRYYDRRGNGLLHDTGWCITCHDHSRGFSPTPP